MDFDTGDNTNFDSYVSGEIGAVLEIEKQQYHEIAGQAVGQILSQLPDGTVSVTVTSLDNSLPQHTKDLLTKVLTANQVGHLKVSEVKFATNSNTTVFPPRQ